MCKGQIYKTEVLYNYKKYGSLNPHEQFWTIKLLHNLRQIKSLRAAFDNEKRDWNYTMLGCNM